jgi:PAS domain S-box-containing protein
MRDAEHYQFICEMIADCIVSFQINDDNTLHIEWTSGQESIAGYAREDLIENFVDYVHPDDRESTRQKLAAIHLGKMVAFKCRLQAPDDTLHLIDYQIYPIKEVAQSAQPRFYGLIQDITQSNQLEPELSEDKVLLNTLMGGLPDDSIYFKDHELRHIRVNQNMIDRLRQEGKSTTNIIGKTDSEIYGKAFGEQTRLTEEQIITTGEPIIGLIESRPLADGETLWTSTSKSPLRDANGQIIGLVGITRKINDIIQTHEALQASEEAAQQFQRQLRALQEINIELAREETFDSLCHSAVALGRLALEVDRLSMWFLDETVPNTMVGSFGTNEQGKIRDERNKRHLFSSDSHVMKLLAEETPVYYWEHTNLYNDNHEIIGSGWQAMALLWDGDNHIGWLSADNFISQEPPPPHFLELIRLFSSGIGHLCTRKRTERNLQENEALLRTVIDADPNYIYVTNADGYFILVNQAMAALHNTTPAEVLGQLDNCLDGHSTEELEAARAENLAIIHSQQPKFIAEESYTTPSGITRWLQTTKIPLSLRGNPDCILGVSVDITERKHTEKHRLDLARERERIVVLQRFISGAAHDLITPLTTMRTSLYLLRKTIEDEKSLNRLDILDDQSSHIEASVNNLLKMSRIDRSTFRFEPVAFNQIVEDIIMEQSQVAITRDQQIVCKLAESIDQVLLDYNEFRYALRQLLANALAYSEPGDQVMVQTSLANEQVVLTVIDYGSGIAPEDLPHIFDPFYRAKARQTDKGGVGLGLTITKWIVEAHNGQIQVESTVGSGSTFRVYLPLKIENGNDTSSQ